MVNRNMKVLVFNMMLAALAALVTLVGLVGLVNTATTETGIDRECKPRPVLFNLGIGRNHYVELYRCLGHTPDGGVHHRCINTTYSTVKVTQTDSILYNHTQCAMRCACNTGEMRDETCVAPNSNVFCYPGQKWDPTTCVCENVARVGPDIATSTKESEAGSGGVSWALFVFSLIAELVVVVAISYCINRPTNKISKTTGDHREDIPVFNRLLPRNSFPTLFGDSARNHQGVEKKDLFVCWTPKFSKMCRK